MKNKIFKLSILALALLFSLVGCKKDDPDPEPIVYEDGIYLVGASTAFDSIRTVALVAPGFVEGEGNAPVARTGYYEKFISVSAAGEGFNLVVVEGGTPKYYGPKTNTVVTLAGELAQITADVQVGKIDTAAGKFTVPADGLYHFVYDKTSSTYVIVPVTKWALIGGFSSWSDTDMPLVGAFSKETMKYELTGQELRAGEFKFRYSGGWKVIIGEDIAGTGNAYTVFTNFGGVISGTLPNLTSTLVEGAATNMAFDEANEGIYTVSLTWNFETGFTSAFSKTGTVEPLAYPEELYMIGDGVGTWDFALTILPMVPVHSHPELFWKIVWMNETGGFKFSPVLAFNGDFGKTGTATNGVYAKGTENVPVPGTAGYYMVVVDFENETIEVADPKVYGIGDAFGGWDAAQAANLFTVDNANEEISITKTLAAGNLRMHVAASTLVCEWWQAEFNVLSGVLEFRGTGGDQTAVPVTAGSHTIKLNFKDLTGTIE